jgi:hypothetical protein
MIDLYFNPLAFDTVQEKWNVKYSSKINKVKDLIKALKYDILIKNPYDLIISNSKKIFSSQKSKVEKVAASTIVILSFIYTNLLYSCFIFSFTATFQKIAFFSNSVKLIQITASINNVAGGLILIWTKPFKFVLYEIPKQLMKKLPLFLKNSIDKVCQFTTFVFTNILVPFFKLLKKIVFWNQFQILLTARMIFDKSYKIYDLAYQNLLAPFWVNRIKPKMNRLTENIKNITPSQIYVFA